jgi:hypothetical protein
MLNYGNTMNKLRNGMDAAKIINDEYWALVKDSDQLDSNEEQKKCFWYMTGTNIDTIEVLDDELAKCAAGKTQLLNKFGPALFNFSSMGLVTVQNMENINVDPFDRYFTPNLNEQQSTVEEKQENTTGTVASTEDYSIGQENL